MSDSMEKLKQLGKEIDTAKTDVAQAEGKLQSYLTRLNDELGLESEQKAEQEVMSIDDEIKSLNEELDQKMAKLQEKYQW